jgi:Tfp pilus assembly PilM family ATPase
MNPTSFEEVIKQMPKDLKATDAIAEINSVFSLAAHKMEEFKAQYNLNTPQGAKVFLDLMEEIMDTITKICDIYQVAKEARKQRVRPSLDDRDTLA